MPSCCPTTAATKFSNYIFDMKPEKLKKSMTEDALFTAKAILVNPPAENQTLEYKIEGRDMISHVFNERMFKITTYCNIKSISYQELSYESVKVTFASDETKTEADGPTNYKYHGHYILFLNKDDEGAYKVSSIYLENTRTKVENFEDNSETPELIEVD